MNELDPNKDYNPTWLFLRADERAQQIEADVHDTEIQFRDHKNEVAERFRALNDVIAKLSERMEGQVTNTGHKNTDNIKKLETKMEKFETQLFDKDTGLITQFVMARRAMYGLLATGLTAICAWAWQHFVR